VVTHEPIGARPATGVGRSSNRRHPMIAVKVRHSFRMPTPVWPDRQRSKGAWSMSDRSSASSVGDFLLGVKSNRVVWMGVATDWVRVDNGRVRFLTRSSTPEEAGRADAAGVTVGAGLPPTRPLGGRARRIPYGSGPSLLVSARERRAHLTPRFTSACSALATVQTRGSCGFMRRPAHESLCSPIPRRRSSRASLSRLRMA
jgi:hypothetical protein